MATLGSPASPPDVASLLQGIGHDVKTIAVDELELARSKLGEFMVQLVIKASVALLGAMVALIGLGMLCMVVVVALAPVVPALWLRLLVMAVVYIAAGAGMTVLFMKRATAMRAHELDHPIAQVAATAKAVERGLEH